MHEIVPIDRVGIFNNPAPVDASGWKKRMLTASFLCYNDNMY